MVLPIIYRQELREYDFGPGHPFRGDRYEEFPDFLRQKLAEGVDFEFVAAAPAGDDDLALICRPDYVDFCRRYYGAASLGQERPPEEHRYLSPDNIPPGRPGRLEEAARLIIGQAKKAADLLVEGASSRVVALGGGMHHAREAFGEGFCIYNDVAFCARYLTQQHGLERVMVIDTDAHAGNGTAGYFYDDPSVLLVDLHQDPRSLYPGTGFADQTGAGEGKGYTVNVPMPLFSGDESYRLVFEEIVRPLAAEYRPQVIIRNGGSDPHCADELTSLGMQVSGFRMLGEQVRGLAELCGARQIDLIGSGYNRQVLPWAWLALITGLLGLELPLEEPCPAPAWLGVDRSLSLMRGIIQQVKNNLKDYWACLR